MRPERSYVIWFSQRCGSTLLASALARTGCAGVPDEWLNASGAEEVPAKFGVTEPGQLQQELWRCGTTPNGVFGLKYGLSEPHHGRITTLLKQFPGCGPDAGESEAWRNALPAWRHVFMTRRNKIRLAVSWWRAIQSGEWHRPSDTPARPGGDATYSFEAIDQLVAEATFREAGLQAFFDRCEIVPMTVVYEDFVAAYRDTVLAVLSYLEARLDRGIAVPEPGYERISDAVSDEWAERYRHERQQGWTNRGW